VCVNRCREGSDIKNLDCGIYLDNVKKRSTLVLIQTVGSILRPDKNKNKKLGR
jgi:superfamily II DNA or RNA helicase